MYKSVQNCFGSDVLACLRRVYPGVLLFSLVRSRQADDVLQIMY